MNNRTRFHELMNFRPVDRLPRIEWAGWWDKTIERWHQEGLPKTLTDGAEIRAYLGLDAYYQTWCNPRKSTLPAPSGHGKGLVLNLDDYRRIKEHLYPDPDTIIDHAMIESWAREQAAGDAVIWLTLEGFFWYPRTLMGIEHHLYAFYEDTETMLAMKTSLRLAFARSTRSARSASPIS